METGPDRSGLKRDTAYFLGYQVIALALLYTLPAEDTNWKQEDKDDYSFRKWRKNVTHPRWDEDDWRLNYLTHPYWGAAYFVRGRERGLDDTQAFFFSTLLSSLYEFGGEALFEPVSIQDVIVTPVFGSLLGRYFMSVREAIQRRAETPRLGDSLLLVLTDPLGAANRLIDDALGVNSSLRIGLSSPATLYHADERPADSDRVALQRAFSTRDAVWALELRVRW